MTKNRADAYWIANWYNHFNSMPYYDNIPDYVVMRAFKNKRRWQNPNSLFSKIFKKV